VPNAKDKLPDPPPAEAWARAKVLAPTLVAREPELISDGGGLPFAPSTLTLAFPPLEASDPPVGALLVQIERARRNAQPSRPFRPKARPPAMEASALLAGWRELARSEDEILYGRGQPPQLVTVAVRRRRRDKWDPLGASNSRPLRAWRDGARASSWRLDPSFEVESDHTELRILVTEQTYASGTPAADRLQTPELYLDDDEAIVRVYIEPLVGYVGRTARHETPMVITLPEPIGEREVVDGALYEPAGAG